MRRLASLMPTPALLKSRCTLPYSSEHAFGEGVDRLCARDVDLHAIDGEPLARELFPGLCDRLRVDVRDDDLCAFTASWAAMARPTPLAPPVTTATLSEKSRILRMPFGRERDLDALLRVVVSLNEKGLQPLARHRTQDFAPGPRGTFGELHADEPLDGHVDERVAGRLAEDDPAVFDRPHRV